MTPTRLKDIGRWYSGGTPPKDRENLWIGDIPWISAKDIDSTRLRPPTVFISEEAAARHSRLVPVGSLLLIVRGMALAHGLPVVVTDRPVAFNQDLRALVPARGIESRFVYYSLIGHRWRLNRHIDQAAHGTARVTDSLYTERLPVPSVVNQRRIADFLDRECARIGALREEVARTTRLSQCSLQSVFQQLVMPRACGAIPMRRVILSISDGPFGSDLASEHYTQAEEVRVIRLGNIGRAEFVGTDRAFVSFEYADEVLADHSVAPGNVVVAGLGDVNHPLGRACVVPDDLGRAIHKADCYRVVVDTARCAPDYLALALSFGPATQTAPLLSRGATRARLNTVVARDLPVPVLEREAQESLCDEFRDRRAEMRELESQYGLLDLLLVEYRDALITDAVTGKLDVSAVSETQMDEAIHAAREGERPEVLAS